MGDRKKSFFERPTPSQIKRLTDAVIEQTDMRVRALYHELRNTRGTNSAVLWPEPLVKYPHRTWKKPNRKLILRPDNSDEEAIYRGESYFEKKIQMARNIRDSPLAISGYNDSGIRDGKDQRMKTLHLLDGALGGKHKSYPYQVNGPNTGRVPRPSFENIECYDGLARIEGAKIVLKVPSATKHKARYPVVLKNVPVINNRAKFAISRKITPEHMCGKKDYGEIKFSTDERPSFSESVDFCQHVVAAYLAVIEHYLKLENKVPLEMCPVDIPRQECADLVADIEQRVLFKDGDKIRRANVAEIEAILWEGIKDVGYDSLFYTGQPEALDSLITMDWHTDWRERLSS
jgi:hypothetical protein